ncbi:hypothetical protein F8S13_09475 [Chloroflexia bacterium SDU3-3]|nr:hypothetical protein F8S13_09475 [Chloroflexia bacterium SDU3-3]
MLRRPHPNSAERATHLMDQLHSIAEGAVIDWLLRTGQWDPEAETKIQRFLDTQRSYLEPQAEAEPAPEQQAPAPRAAAQAARQSDRHPFLLVLPKEEYAA